MTRTQPNKYIYIKNHFLFLEGDLSFISFNKLMFLQKFQQKKFETELTVKILWNYVIKTFKIMFSDKKLKVSLEVEY